MAQQKGSCLCQESGVIYSIVLCVCTAKPSKSGALGD